MISCPRVLEFEKLIIDWGIKLLEKNGQQELFKRSSLEEEQKEVVGVDDFDYQLFTILKHNITAKQIYYGQLKTLKVIKAILERLTDIEIDDDSGYARATQLPVEGLETEDEENEFFRRHMGMRNYFKLLKMSMVAVRNAKLNLEEKKRNGTAGDDETASTTLTDEVTPKQASAALEAAAMSGGAASITNPPAKGIGKKKKVGGKKKAVKKKAVKK